MLDSKENFTDLSNSKIQNKNLIGNSSFYNKNTQEITQIDNLVSGSGNRCDILKLPNPTESDYVLRQGFNVPPIDATGNPNITYKIRLNLKPAKYLFSVWV